MAKAVIGEKAQLKIAEDRLSNSSVLSEVGLVIGKTSSVLDRGFVFELVPAPHNDAVAAPADSGLVLLQMDMLELCGDVKYDE